jgi:acylphosphatase
MSNPPDVGRSPHPVGRATYSDGYREVDGTTFSVPVRRAHVWISGMVQGVFFRYEARERARSRGVSGWVRNLADGRVEAVFEGPEDAVETMVEWCGRGPRGAEVTDVEAVAEDPEGLEGFDVLH